MKNLREKYRRKSDAKRSQNRSHLSVNGLLAEEVERQELDLSFSDSVG